MRVFTLSLLISCIWTVLLIFIDILTPCFVMLCSDLFSLNCIQSDPMFRNADYIAPSKAKAIDRLMVDMCKELRQVALPLVASFAIPDHILRSPIGLSTSTDIYKEYLSAAGFEVQA